jgi:hypothetical protein
VKKLLQHITLAIFQYNHHLCQGIYLVWLLFFVFQCKRTLPPAHATTLWPRYSVLLHETSGWPNVAVNVKTNRKGSMLGTKVLPPSQHWFPFPYHLFCVFNFSVTLILAQATSTLKPSAGKHWEGNENSGKDPVSTKWCLETLYRR